jgi:geranylgeranyl pyrophosphate synthase
MVWDIHHFNHALHTWVTQHMALPLQRCAHYVIATGGKRFRPWLIHALTKLYNVDPIVQHYLQLAIECVHLYTLIHDDLPSMDNDNLRRGWPTAHVQFSEAIALLTGNAFYTLGISALARIQHHAIQQACITILANGTQALLGGQCLDIQNLPLTPQRWLHISALKTSQLFKIAGRWVCAASFTPHHNVSRYLHALGLLYQWLDDSHDQQLPHFAILWKTSLLAICQKRLPEALFITHHVLHAHDHAN